MAYIPQTGTQCWETPRSSFCIAVKLRPEATLAQFCFCCILIAREEWPAPPRGLSRRAWHLPVADFGSQQAFPPHKKTRNTITVLVPSRHPVLRLYQGWRPETSVRLKPDSSEETGGPQGWKSRRCQRLFLFGAIRGLVSFFFFFFWGGGGGG